jgi:hypothetical protein
VPKSRRAIQNGLHASGKPVNLKVSMPMQDTIVSVCAGHGDPVPGPAPIYIERRFAEVRFAIFYASSDRLAAQQARICTELLAYAAAGEDTVIETFHEVNIDQGSRVRRRHRLGRSLVCVRHARPTAEAPDLAQDWWRRLVARLEAGTNGSP